MLSTEAVVEGGGDGVGLGLVVVEDLVRGHIVIQSVQENIHCCHIGAYHYQVHAAAGYTPHVLRKLQLVMQTSHRSRISVCRHQAHVVVEYILHVHIELH